VRKKGRKEERDKERKKCALQLVKREEENSFEGFQHNPSAHNKTWWMLNPIRTWKDVLYVGGWFKVYVIVKSSHGSDCR